MENFNDAQVNDYGTVEKDTLESDECFKGKLIKTVKVNVNYESDRDDMKELSSYWMHFIDEKIFLKLIIFGFLSQMEFIDNLTLDLLNLDFDLNSFANDLILFQNYSGFRYRLEYIHMEKIIRLIY